MGRNPHRLSPQEESFAMLYVAGDDETRGNATESYFRAYGGNMSRSTAANGGSRLVRRERVRARMRDIREQAERDAKARLVSFMAEASKAQRTLLQAMTLDWPAGTTDQEMRSAVEAAKEWLTRALGPTGKTGEGTSGGTVQVLVANVTTADLERLQGGERLGRGVEVLSLPAPD